MLECVEGSRVDVQSRLNSVGRLYGQRSDGSQGEPIGQSRLNGLSRLNGRAD